MRFLLITFVFLFIQVFSCNGIYRNKNSTEDPGRLKSNDTRLSGYVFDEASTSTKTVEVEEKDDDEESEEVVIEEKFVSPASYITLDHIDFVMLRLGHIAKKTTSNITELRILQKKEFSVNEIYKVGWEKAAREFNNSIRSELLETYSNDSVVAKVPEEYHIALIAYSLQFPTPTLYSNFNKRTREVCSGTDIDKYNYKSYFKFLLLAIETLGKEEMRFRSKGRFLYRGVGSAFALEVGQVMAFQHFVSTSTTLKVAENFTGNTLFEIQGMYDTAISIKDHSLFTDEEEVLFSPFQVYEVESKHEGTYYTRYVLIAHKYTSPGTSCSKDDDKPPNEFIGDRSVIKSQLLQPQQLNSSAKMLSNLMPFIVWFTIFELISFHRFLINF